MEHASPSGRSFVQAPDPTPNEIRRLCLEIQATWSERERRSRAGVYGDQPPVDVMVCEAGAVADGSTRS